MLFRSFFLNQEAAATDIQALEQKIKSLKQKFEKSLGEYNSLTRIQNLKKRRAIDTEGYKNEISFLHKKIKSLENDLMKQQSLAKREHELADLQFLAKEKAAKIIQDVQRLKKMAGVDQKPDFVFS